MFEIIFTQSAHRELERLEGMSGKEGLVKQIKKTLGFLQTNPRQPSLNTHPYQSIPHPYDSSKKVFGAYAQNKTPSAYRIFWCYGSGERQMTIIAITPHP